MKVTLFITFFLISMCNIAFCQDFKNDLTSLKTIDALIQSNDNSIEDTSNTIDRMVLKTPANTLSKKDKHSFSKKEWRKIKKQRIRSKRRFSRAKNCNT